MKTVIHMFPDHGIERFYVRVNDDGTYSEVYNPNFATQFSSKAKATEWLNTYCAQKDYGKLVDYTLALKLWNEWSGNGCVRRTMPVINLEKSRKYDPAIHTPMDVVRQRLWMRQNEQQVSSEVYRTWPELYLVFKHLHGVYCTYRDDETKLFFTFEVFTSRNGKFADFKAEINSVIDMVDYIDEDGWKVFPVFDHYLSEGGNKVYLKNRGDKWRIDGRWTPGVVTTMAKAFEELRNHRWYDHD